MGRLIGTTTQYSFLPGVTYSNGYGYDAASNRTSFTAPDGSTVNYAYDTLSRLTSLTDSLTGQFTFGYDALSRRTSLTRPNGVNTSYTYDSLSRLLSVLHQAGTVTLDGASYTYDNAGNRVSKTNSLNNTTENYTYDPLYQLTQVAQGLTTTESYTYDAVGNRLSSLGMSPYAYNSSNELTSTPSATFTYDANGSTLTKVDSAGTTTYNWDFENRLTSVALPGTAGTVTFKYDPFGRRIQKSSSSGTTNYLYDGSNSVEETDQTGAELAHYSQGAGVDEPLAAARGGAVGFYDQDGLGSVTSLTGSTGAVLNSYTYDAFGDVTASTGSFVNPFQYTGRDYDPETGLQYYRARYYDPGTGRFIGADPTTFAGGINFYSYADNEPTLFVDPTGLQAQPNPVPKPFLVPKADPQLPWELPKIPGWWWIPFVDMNSGNDPWKLHCADVIDPRCPNQQPVPDPDQKAKPCSGNGCKPCIPPVGTLAYREETSPASPPHRGVPTPHWHLYEMMQNPVNCQCFWHKIPDNKGGFGASPPPAGAVPITPSGGGGPA